MLSNIISLVSGCVTFLGGFVVVWGAVSLGLAIKDETRGGAQIAGATSSITLRAPGPSRRVLTGAAANLQGPVSR